MTKWQEVKLGDVCDFQNGYAFKSSEFVANGNINIVKIKELKNGQIVFTSDTAKVVNSEIYKQYQVSTGDILVALTGDPVSKPNPLSWVGRVALYNHSVPALLNQRVAKFLPNKFKLDTKFIYYFFREFDNFFNLAQKATGSASQANISTKILSETIIPLPPMDIQKKIAGVLGALDDKIELNNKINNNLEQQAQALIQEHINNLKTIVPLDEFCNVFTGRKNANEFEAGGVNKFFTCGPEALTINSFIYDGPAVIISGNGAYTGRTRFYNGKFDLYQRTYACTLKEQINGNYIYLLYPLLKMVLEKKLMGGTHGSAIPYIVMNDIAKFEVPFEKEVFDRISPACKALVDKIQFNEQENEKLASLRDALLPKLMSGEIDVSSESLRGIE